MAHPIPMRLLATPEPFDHPEFVYEPKLDGFRALAYVTGHRCELVSRNGQRFKSWPLLAEEIAHAIRAHGAVLDGEICCLPSDGRTNFHAVMFRRSRPWFHAFDVLSVNGVDLCGLPLLERKRRLQTIMPAIECRLLYLDHLAERGRDLFRVACERDLEGIVAKWARGPYHTDGRSTSWLKIKNPHYPQMRDRQELFSARQPEGFRRRGAAFSPALRLW
jgi:bifunctional non-homologous end joining protein LigD